MKRVIVGLMIILLLLVGLMSACAPKTGEVVNVGVIVGLTGPGAAWGVGIHNTYQVWQDDVNKAGGLKVGGKTYPVKVIGYDCRWDPTVAVEAANKAIFQDKVKVLGTMVPTDKPIMPLATDNKVICWGHNREPLLRGEWPYLFRVTPEIYEITSACYRWMVEEMPELKRVAVVAQDTDNARVTYDSLIPIYEELGFQLVETVWYPSDAKDFYPYVSPVLRGEPDIIETSGSAPELMAGTCKAARELGFWGPMIGAGVLPETMLEIAGAENAEGFITLGGWEHDERWEGATPDECAFPDRYKAFFGNEDLMCGVYYNDLLLWQQAVEKAQSLDPDEVVQAFHGYEFENFYLKGRFYGKERYGVDNQFPPVVWLSRMTGGNIVTIKMVPPPEKMIPY